MTANDLEAHHLEILRKNIPTDYLSRLTLKVGKFPQEVAFPSESFDTILMSQMIHFLRAEEIVEGLSLLYQWLKPKGKIFVTAISS